LSYPKKIRFHSRKRTLFLPYFFFHLSCVEENAGK
jgi:hypothetical protein